MELEMECDETKPPYRHIGRPPASGQDLINLSEITLVCVDVCVCVSQGPETHDSSGMLWLQHRCDFTFSADRSSIFSGASARERHDETITMSKNCPYRQINVPRWQKNVPPHGSAANRRINERFLRSVS